MGGVRVEERLLDGFDALLHMSVDCHLSPGMLREAQYMAERGKPVYQVVDRRVVELTEDYQ